MRTSRPRCTPTRPRALVSTGRASPRPPLTPWGYGPPGVSHSAPLLSCLRLGSVLPSVATWALRPYRAGVPRVVRVRRLARRLSVYVLGGRDGDLGARRDHQRHAYKSTKSKGDDEDEAGIRARSAHVRGWGPVPAAHRGHGPPALGPLPREVTQRTRTLGDPRGGRPAPTAASGAPRPGRRERPWINRAGRMHDRWI